MTPGMAQSSDVWMLGLRLETPRVSINSATRAREIHWPLCRPHVMSLKATICSDDSCPNAEVHAMKQATALDDPIPLESLSRYRNYSCSLCSNFLPC
ncbi:hypothetical protein HBI22_124470 [Parastagonospora nodorum]|nr:hypothetical protein HBH42_067710 [Parastagonospora nodorum]KAH5477103.1 hypothetical protein HBI28_077660 [Parastagonospora nodorum]KAH5630283.1 hypothetical protein HBI22_124470 [Parastagonospora nodorum]KAH6124892.1 hypothetical protein HBI69_041220 [Parastagonospora nodorum]